MSAEKSFFDGSRTRNYAIVSHVIFRVEHGYKRGSPTSPTSGKFIQSATGSFKMTLFKNFLLLAIEKIYALSQSEINSDSEIKYIFLIVDFQVTLI